MWAMVFFSFLSIPCPLSCDCQPTLRQAIALTSCKFLASPTSFMTDSWTSSAWNCIKITGCGWKTVFGDTWMLREKGENYVSIWSFESPSLPTHPAPKFSINLRNNYLPMLGAGMGKLSFSHREFQGRLTGVPGVCGSCFKSDSPVDQSFRILIYWGL